MPMKLADFLSTCDRVRRRSTQEPFDPWLRKQRLLSGAITPSRSQSVLDNSEERVQRRVVAEFVDGSRHLAARRIHACAFRPAKSWEVISGLPVTFSRLSFG